MKRKFGGMTFFLVCILALIASTASVFAGTTLDPHKKDEPHDTTLLKEAPDWESPEFKKEKQEALEKKAAEEQAAAAQAPAKKKKDRARALRKMQK